MGSVVDVYFQSHDVRFENFFDVVEAAIHPGRLLQCNTNIEPLTNLAIRTQTSAGFCFTRLPHPRYENSTIDVVSSGNSAVANLVLIVLGRVSHSPPAGPLFLNFSMLVDQIVQTPLLL